jgi:hypothetical protein
LNHHSLALAAQAMSDPIELLREEFDQAVVAERTAYWEVRAAMRDLRASAPAQIVARWKLASEEWTRARARVDAIVQRLNETANGGPADRSA